MMLVTRDMIAGQMAWSLVAQYEKMSKRAKRKPLDPRDAQVLGWIREELNSRGIRTDD